ncbi:MAG: N-acetyltransferase, partial [Gammaproteobacteria bacterium]|nr:N-acetyltransferase [Gammaproteobacteria bacterium]
MDKVRDRDAILALAKRSTPWRCGLGRFADVELARRLDGSDSTSTRLHRANGAVSGFANVTPRVLRGFDLTAIAVDGPAFRALVDWAVENCPGDTALHTSASATDDASTALSQQGFRSYLVQRTMEFRAGAPKVSALPTPYRFADLAEVGLAALMATYVVAWPEDDVDEADAEESFRETDGLVVACDAAHVAGYAMWERTEDGIGVIHEVAVHPNHRRLGIGAALTMFAVERLRPVTSRIELVVMEENPAQRLYERLGFEVVEDLVFMHRQRQVLARITHECPTADDDTLAVAGQYSCVLRTHSLRPPRHSA